MNEHQQRAEIDLHSKIRELRLENAQLRTALANRDNAEMIGLRTALVAMKIASAIPAVADEYDFDHAITELTELVKPTVFKAVALPSQNQTERS